MNTEQRIVSNVDSSEQLPEPLTMNFAGTRYLVAWSVAPDGLTNVYMASAGQGS